jgi:hypothetical protein
MTARSPAVLLLALLAVLASGCATKTGARPQEAPAHATMHDLPVLERAADADDADASLDFIEYRVQPELGQISIFTGTLYGRRTVDRARKAADMLTRKGILVSAGDAPRMLHRTDTLGGKKFETLVLAAPPEPEDPDAGWTRRLLVTVDGRLKIDCSLGDAGADANLFVYGVQLFPEDAKLSVSASDNDGHELTLPDDVMSLDDEAALTDDAFEEPADDEPEPESQAPVRV